MSLLLLFPSRGLSWTKVAKNASAWTRGHYDFFNIWGEWSTTTWGTLQSSNRTWRYMAGDTFNKTTVGATTWTKLS